MRACPNTGFDQVRDMAGFFGKHSYQTVKGEIMMRVALIQMDIILGDVDANRAKAAKMIEQSLAEGAQLIVLPELWTTGYKLAEIKSLAEPPNGPTVSMLSALSRKKTVSRLSPDRLPS